VRHPRSGRGMLSDYRHHRQLELHITALENVPFPDGDNHRPPPNEGEMIPKHLPLVRSYAKKRATQVSNELG
jgi:hypothetical protein